MHKRTCFDKPLRALCAACALLGAVACGAATSDTTLGSETHFLARCTAECGGGLACIDGVCTRACSLDEECTPLSAAAVCAPMASGGGSCRVACGGDGDCRAQNTEWSCAAASCERAPALLSTAGPTASARCPTFSGGVQVPREVQATFAGVPGSANIEWSYVDASGVYWTDSDGAILGVKNGASGATTLRPAPSTTSSRLGLIGDSERLYWTEAGAYPPGPPEPSPPPPPGRLLSISKSGGVPELIVESAEHVLTPLGVDSTGRVLLTTEEGDLNAVSASGALERVANVPRVEGGGMRMVDGQIYWVEYEEAQDTSLSVLFTAIPGSGAPVRVTPIDQVGIVQFVAGRGVVLWAPGETRLDPLVLVQHFMMLNQNTGCVQELPSVELSIGQTLIDERHVYWESFNGLGTVRSDEPLPAITLLRVDLRSGRFEQVIVPGMELTVGSDLVAQDDTTIYVRQGPGLFAVRKPQ